MRLEQAKGNCWNSTVISLDCLPSETEDGLSLQACFLGDTFEKKNGNDPA